jgi:hypothetical protein
MAYMSGDGGYRSDASLFRLDASADTVSVPDAELLFRGHFARSGPDLVLTGQDGHRHVVPGYFANEKHLTLVAPNGAHLSGDLVDHLAGSPTPGHYAQAQTSAPTDPIGQVEKVVGVANVVRNGVSVSLHVGDKVYQSDVVQTGADSSCGIAFPDGTALNLVAKTRLVLNEYSFDANSTSNTALFSLVEGTFAAVAGAIAHTGSMKVGTPVATMGIRGTTFVLGTILGEVFFLLREDYHTDHHKGALAIEDFGIEISDTDAVTYCTTASCRSEPLSTSQQALFREIIDGLDRIIDRASNQNSNQSPGSGDNPNLLLLPFQLLEENGGKPLFVNFQFDGGNNFVTPSTNFGPPTDFGLALIKPPIVSSSPVFIWNSNGPASWSQQLVDWNQGSAPMLPIDTVVIQSGVSNYDIARTTTIGFLTVDAGATLEITAGELIAGGLIDKGTIIVGGDPPTLNVNGPVEIGSGCKIEVVGSGSELEFTGSTLINQGVIAARHHGQVDFTGEEVTNGLDDDASITVTNCGAITFEYSDAANIHGSVIEAEDHGIVKFDGTFVANEDGAIINAAGRWSVVDFCHSSVENTGTIKAECGGTIYVDNTAVDNTCGTIAAIGCDAVVDLDQALISGGWLKTNWGGLIQTVTGDSAFDELTIGDGTRVLVNEGTSLTLQGTIINKGDIDLNGGVNALDQTNIHPLSTLAIDGTVKLTGYGDLALEGSCAGIIGGSDDCNTLYNVNDTISGGGNIGIGDQNLSLDNEAFGTIDANISGESLTINTGNPITNLGQLEATNHGELLVEDLVNPISVAGNALIKGGTIDFEGATKIDVTFDNSTGYGELVLVDPKDFSGTISGFNGQDSEAPSLANTDEVDLVGFETTTEATSETGVDGTVTLALQDGFGDKITLTFIDPGGALNVESDGHGGTLITDLPTAGSSGTTSANAGSAGDTVITPPQILIGGPGKDTFVFRPGMGAETIGNFNPQVDNIELQHFADIENAQQLARLITTDLHSDAVSALGHSDSITIPGVTQSYFQAHLQSLIHFH